jgi:hypothetical protein
MRKLGDIFLFYIILFVSFVGLYILIRVLSGFNNSDLSEVTLTIGGGILGGLCYALFQKAFMDK